jgi:hypothetical protein
MIVIKLSLYYFTPNFFLHVILVSISVAAASKAWVCDPSLVGTPGSNQARGLDVCLLCLLCVVR